MANPPVPYIPFVQTVAPMHVVVEATAITVARNWHAARTASFGDRTAMGVGVQGYKRFGRSTGHLYMAPDGSAPEDHRGSVVSTPA